MLIAILIISLFTPIAVIGGVFYGKRTAEKAIGKFYTGVYSYLTTKDGEGFTPIDALLKGLSAQVVEALEVKFNARIMANNSHVSRQSNLLEQDMMQDYVNNQSPLLGLLLDNMPSVKKRLTKNRTAVDAFLPMFNGFMEKMSKNNGGAGSGITGGGPDDWIQRL